MRSDRGHRRAEVSVMIVARETEGVAVVMAAGEEGERAGCLLGVIVTGQTVLLRGRRRVQPRRDGRGRAGGGRIEEVLQRRHCGVCMCMVCGFAWAFLRVCLRTCLRICLLFLQLVCFFLLFPAFSSMDWGWKIGESRCREYSVVLRGGAW